MTDITTRATEQSRKPNRTSDKLHHVTIPLYRILVLSDVPHNISLLGQMGNVGTGQSTSSGFDSGPAWM
jgi:hypothetical protein